jgi:hypothetical protein
MEARLPVEQRPAQEDEQVATNQESESSGLPASWTSADLKTLADKVYELLLQDLMLERERGLW